MTENDIRFPRCEIMGSILNRVKPMKIWHFLMLYMAVSICDIGLRLIYRIPIIYLRVIVAVRILLFSCDGTRLILLYILWDVCHFDTQAIERSSRCCQ